jgi:hypothetical protein
MKSKYDVLTLSYMLVTGLVLALKPAAVFYHVTQVILR